MTRSYSAPQTKKHFRSKIRLKAKNKSQCRITVRMKKARSLEEAKRIAIRSKIHVLMSIRWKTLWKCWPSPLLPTYPYKHKTMSLLRKILIRSWKVWPWKQKKSRRASTSHFTSWIALYRHRCKSKAGTAPTRIQSLAERPPLSLIMIQETVGKWY